MAAPDGTGAAAAAGRGRAFELFASQRLQRHLLHLPSGARRVETAGAVDEMRGSHPGRLCQAASARSAVRDFGRPILVMMDKKLKIIFFHNNPLF